MGTIFVGPFEAPKYSCFPVTLPEGGLWPKFDYVNPETNFFTHTLRGSVAASGVGCGDPERPCLLRTDYQLATVERVDR